MPKQKTSPICHFANAFGYSMRGLRAAWHNEEAFREEVYILIIVAPLGLWLGHSALERLLLVGSWGAVMVVELLNSALEAAVDRMGEERHELAGRAKDMGSAAVMLAIVLAIAVWVAVLASR